MTKKKVDALLISSLPNIFYLTSFPGFSSEDRDAFLLITKSSQYIFTHGIYKEAVRKHLKKFDLIEIRRESPINQSIKDLVDKYKIKNLGFESFDLKVSEYENILKFVNKKILKPLNLIDEIRITKTQEEIRTIKNACEIGDKVYSQVLKKIRVGINEQELAFEIDHLIRKQGLEPSFPTIVAFGENAAHPHHVPIDKKLTKNNFVLMDFGVKFENYCSDMTRTVFFGNANKEQKTVYQTVFNSQKLAIQSFEKGIRAEKLDKLAREYILKNGYPQIPHSLGHGIGLQVHESPRLSPNTKDKLENGMVFSIEPGIYLPNEMGVRIEDLFAIIDNKLIQLTKSQRTLIEISAKK